MENLKDIIGNLLLKIFELIFVLIVIAIVIAIIYGSCVFVTAVFAFQPLFGVVVGFIILNVFLATFACMAS
jgi:hypothetical protein